MKKSLIAALALAASSGHAADIVRHPMVARIVEAYEADSPHHD